MKLTVDTERQTLSIDDREIPLYSPEAFQAVSREWVRIGWALQHYFTFTWAGLPILQLPEDLVRLQEVIWTLQPDVILETGVFGGGSMVFHASICEAIGKGRVIGIDKHIDAETRAGVEGHRLAHRITLIEGNSVSDEVVNQAKSLIHCGETVLVLLDSHHSREHVAAELEAYAPLVTEGSYIVAADGIMRDLTDVPGGNPEWITDNPAQAAIDFAAKHADEFEAGPPEWRVNRSPLKENITYWPDGWLRRKKTSRSA